MDQTPITHMQGECSTSKQLQKSYQKEIYINLILSSKSSREDMCRLPTSFLLNIQSHVKQEVDMPQIQKCVTWYSSPYWCSVPNITKLAFVVPEKNVTEFFCDADARRQKWSLYVASATVGRRHNKFILTIYRNVLNSLYASTCMNMYIGTECAVSIIFT